MTTDLLTSRQAAERLGVSVATLTRWVRAGKITPASQVPHYRGALFFDPADVKALADDRT